MYDAMRPVVREGFAACVLGSCVFAFAAYLLYPGWYSFDSANMLWQARSGDYSNLHPPAMAALWSVLLRNGSAPGGLLLLHLLAAIAGLAMLALTVGGNRALRAIVLALPLWPPFLLLFGHLWSDVELTASLLLAIGLAALALTRQSRASAFGAVVVLGFAVACRHNAALAAWPMLFLLARRRFGASVVDTRNALPSAALATAVLVAMLAIGSVFTRALISREMPSWTKTAIWDLAAVSVTEDRMRLPEGIRGPGLDVAQLRELYTPHQALPLLVGTRSGIRAGFAGPLPDDVRSEVLSGWFRLPIEAPVAYFRHRISVTASLFGTQPADKPEALFMVPEVVAYRDNPAIALNATTANTRLVSLMRQWRSSWLAAPASYLALGVIALVVCVRRAPSQARAIVTAQIASGFAYAAALPLIAPSAEWRYLFWPMFAATLGFVLAWGLPSRDRA